MIANTFPSISSEKKTIYIMKKGRQQAEGIVYIQI